MTPAVQLPYRRQPATPVGPTTFRKQILSKGAIEHDGRWLTFDDACLRQLVDSFNGGAYDLVAFLLADPQSNRHTVDPERVRGELKGVELTNDGLDGFFELEPRGADLIRRNPKLGVSARIVPDVQKADGRRYPLAIQHVLGTLDPVVTGMRQWEEADLAAGHNDVIDLSAATYTDEPTTDPSDDLAELLDLSTEELANLDRLIDEGAEHERLVQGLRVMFDGAPRESPFTVHDETAVPDAVELAVDEQAEGTKRELLTAWESRFGKGLR